MKDLRPSSLTLGPHISSKEAQADRRPAQALDGLGVAERQSGTLYEQPP
jgi:hypothetical protein